MLVSFIILFEIVMIGFFATAYFIKQELFWVVSMILSGMLMIASYNVEVMSLAELHSYSFPFLMGVNLLFFALSLILGLFDIFDKYSISILSTQKKEQ